MQALRRGPFIGALALGLLYVPLLRLVSTREPAPAARPTPPAPRSRPRTPFEAALREASQDRTRAKIAVSRELEALETWDPVGMMGINEEPLRLQRMSADQRDMSRARTAGERATVLGRTRE